MVELGDKSIKLKKNSVVCEVPFNNDNWLKEDKPQVRSKEKRKNNTKYVTGWVCQSGSILGS